MAIPSKRPDCNADTVLPAVATAVAPTYTEGDAVPLSVDLNGSVRTSGGGGGGAGDASAANQTTMIGHLDGLETLIGTTNSTLTTIDGRVDGLEANTASTNTKLDTTIGHLDGVETTLTAIDGRVDGLEGGIGASADAAATAGSTGSLSAKQRLMTSQLDSIKTAVEILDNAVSGTGVNVSQINGVAVTMGNGASGTGVQRVTIANDSTGVLATVTTITTVSTLTGGGVAHDGVDSGNPHKIGAKAETSPKGITLVADADRTDLYADADGLMMVKLNTSGADAISESVSNTDGASTAFTNFSAVASTKNYITAYTAFRTDAGTSMAYIDLRDGTAGSVLWRIPLPPTSGSISPPYNGPCLFKTSANTALAFDVSSALTTVYLNVSGYQSKV